MLIRNPFRLAPVSFDNFPSFFLPPFLFPSFPPSFLPVSYFILEIFYKGEHQGLVVGASQCLDDTGHFPISQCIHTYYLSIYSSSYLSKLEPQIHVNTSKYIFKIHISKKEQNGIEFLPSRKKYRRVISKRTIMKLRITE